MNTISLHSFFRFIKNNILFTSISITGLSIGIASCLLISLYIYYENSYDHYHTKKDRIYRLTSELDFNGNINAALTNLPSAPTLLNEYPEIERFARFKKMGKEVTLTSQKKSIELTHMWYTDSTVFDVFSYPLLYGDPNHALAAPNSIVITENTAITLFEKPNALNQSIVINNRTYQVTGIMQNQNPQSDIKINALVSLSSLPSQFMAAHNQDWFRIGFYTFLLFKQPINTIEFEKKLIDFEKKHVQPWSQENQIEASLTYHITPLTKLHFDNTKTYDTPKGNKSYQLIFALLAIFLLLIAIINYINLSLAQGTKRNKEIGIRKTAGATNHNIFKQFINESFILTLIAASIAILLLLISLPLFNRMLQIHLSIQTLFTPQFAVLFSILLLTITLAANSYPAFIQSQLNPVLVFKGASAKGGRLNGLNYTLLFVQFFFSMFMISATLLVQQQMNFIANHALGFEKEKILSIQIPSDTLLRKQVLPWINNFKNQENIIAVSKTRMPDGNTSGELMFRIEQNDIMVEKAVNFLFVDDAFLEVMGLNVLQGRNFNKEIASDAQQAFIINQKAAEVFGWNTNALNKRIQWGLMPNGQATNDGQVIGVINNFNFKSLHNPMSPLILCYSPRGSNAVAIRYATDNLTPEINKLTEQWNEIAPTSSFKYSALSTSISSNYGSEKRMQLVLTYFSSISILLAVIGLFSLVSNNLQNRMKEMGIRKVLGASSADLIWLIGKKFWILTTIAIMFSTPITWWLFQKWLNQFAYHTTIHIITFVLSYFVILLLSTFSIGYHVWRISQINPANTLRHE